MKLRTIYTIKKSINRFLIFAAILSFHGCEESTKKKDLISQKDHQIEHIILTHPFFSNYLRKSNYHVEIPLLGECVTIKDDRNINAAVYYFNESAEVQIPFICLSTSYKSLCFPILEDYYYTLIAQQKNTKQCIGQNHFFYNCMAIEKGLNCFIRSTEAFSANSDSLINDRNKIFAITDFIFLNAMNTELIDRKKIESGFIQEHKSIYFNDFTLEDQVEIDSVYKIIKQGTLSENLRFYRRGSGFYQITFANSNNMSTVSIELLNSRFFSSTTF